MKYWVRDIFKDKLSGLLYSIFTILVLQYATKVELTLQSLSTLLMITVTELLLFRRFLKVL